MQSCSNQNHKSRSSWFTYSLIAGLILLCNSCSRNEQKETIAEGEVAPVYAIEVGLEAEFGDLFELEEVIPLRINGQEFFTNPYRLIIHDGRFYLLDPVFGSLLCFSGEGEMIFKIGSLGDGPKELPDIADFAINPITQEIILSSIADRSLAYYNLQNQFLRKERYANQSDMIAASAQGLISRSVTYFNNDFHNLEILRQSGEVEKLYFPFPKDLRPILLKSISGHLTSSSDTGFLFMEPASSVIYQVDAKQAIPKYAFTAYDEMWPQEKKHDINGFFTKVSKGEISYPTRFFEENDHLLFFGWNKKIIASGNRIVDYRIGVFNKQGRITVITKPSELTHFISGPMAVEGHSVYFVIPQYKLIEFSQNNFFREKKEVIESIKNTTEDHDLPVILKTKYSKSTPPHSPPQSE
jgi:hypothetical protein